LLCTGGIDLSVLQGLTGIFHRLLVVKQKVFPSTVGAVGTHTSIVVGTAELKRNRIVALSALSAAGAFA